MSAALLSSGRSFATQFACRLGTLSKYRSLTTAAVGRHVHHHSLSQTSPTESPTSQPEVQLTDRCVQKLRSLGEDDSGLRVMVEGGGCSGFQYKFELDSTVRPEDRVFGRDGVKVIVDTDSLEYLRGSTIDYEEELIRSSFKVSTNPQAEHGCSCGVSFSLK